MVNIMKTIITKVENNRVVKFLEIDEELASERLEELSPNYPQAFIFDGIYSPDLWVENGKVTIKVDIKSIVDSKKALVKSKRDELELEGFPYLGKIFDSDPRSFYRITTANDLASKDPNFSIDWKLKDNSFIKLNAQEMQGVMPALAMWGAMIFANANRLKDLLDKAKNDDDLANIDINSGWVDINDYL